MSDVIISVENLGKKYAIQHQQQRQRSNYKSLRETITQKARNLVTGWNRRGPEAAKAKTREDFWALRDVSFDLERGEVLGIIGRNGAGKSTLLKILSRITEPSEGRVTLRGRVASLLEVGTGFHPELTGRENIFLNGSILGMSHAEIRRKFDEIVAFAGVEKFLDTPVKRYSSGMYVRLAFAVAAHLEPEILVVDEVLAVGDAEFQKKCLGKMHNISARNMSAIRSLCNRGILLNAGRVAAMGPPAGVAEQYLEISQAVLLSGDRGQPRITGVSVLDKDGLPAAAIPAGEDATISFRIDTMHKSRLTFAFTVINSDDVGIMSAITSDTEEFIPPGTTALAIQLPTKVLNAGRYRVEGALAEDRTLVEQNECYCRFDIHRSGPFELAGGKPRGATRFPGTWSFK
jgi:lipopolysaccharide transport system ATP-binding protein